MAFHPTSLLAVLLTIAAASSGEEEIAGLYLGEFEFAQHQVQGHLYALDANTLFIHRFYYDGQGPPGVVFYAVPLGEGDDSKGFPTTIGELNGGQVIGETLNANLTLTMPPEFNVNSLQRLVVWCDQFGVSFGRVDLTEARRRPRTLQRPKQPESEVGPFVSTQHAVSGNVYIVDANTLLVRNFNYDGLGASVVFYGGETNSIEEGSVVEYPFQERPSRLGPKQLRRHRHKDIVLRLPSTLDAYKMTYLAVWCDLFGVSFGHVPF